MTYILVAKFCSGGLIVVGRSHVFPLLLDKLLSYNLSCLLADCGMLAQRYHYGKLNDAIGYPIPEPIQ